MHKKHAMSERNALIKIAIDHLQKVVLHPLCFSIDLVHIPALCRTFTHSIQKGSTIGANSAVFLKRTDVKICLYRTADAFGRIVAKAFAALLLLCWTAPFVMHV